MELQIPLIVMRILRIFTVCCLFLDFVSDCYYLAKAKNSWTIHTGIKPEHVAANIGFYVNMGILCWLFLCIFFIAVEIFMFFDVKIFEMFDHGIIKPIIYLVMGFAHLGICGDLGLSCGILTLIDGFVWLVLDILLMI